MYNISRVEQFMIYYWTGTDWSTDEDNAKLFNTSDEARAEVDLVGILYRISINKV